MLDRRQFLALTLAGLALPAWARTKMSRFGVRIAHAALDQVGLTRSYDPAYRALDYPGGDVPIDTGVCADVVVRALRAVGIDLQLEVHRDMRGHFANYPGNWGLQAPDRNIDHRRVPNLRRFFERSGWSLALGAKPLDFIPGDIVSWAWDGRLPHVGIVSTRFVPDLNRRLVVHNISRGAEEEDVLFAWPMTGHYRLPEPPQDVDGR